MSDGTTTDAADEAPAGTDAARNHRQVIIQHHHEQYDAGIRRDDPHGALLADTYGYADERQLAIVIVGKCVLPSKGLQPGALPG